MTGVPSITRQESVARAGGSGRFVGVGVTVDDGVDAAVGVVSKPRSPPPQPVSSVKTTAIPRVRIMVAHQRDKTLPRRHGDTEPDRELPKSRTL